MRGRCSRVSVSSCAWSVTGQLEMDLAVVGVGARARSMRSASSARCVISTALWWLRGLADRRALRGGVTADDAQQLVQGRCHSGVVGGVFAPAQKVAQLCAEREQLVVVGGL